MGAAKAGPSLLTLHFPLSPLASCRGEMGRSPRGGLLGGGGEQRGGAEGAVREPQEGRATGTLGGRQGLATRLWDKGIKDLGRWTSGLWRKAS